MAGDLRRVEAMGTERSEHDKSEEGQGTRAIEAMTVGRLLEMARPYLPISAHIRKTSPIGRPSGKPPFPGPHSKCLIRNGYR